MPAMPEYSNEEYIEENDIPISVVNVQQIWTHILGQYYDDSMESHRMSESTIKDRSSSTKGTYESKVSVGETPFDDDGDVEKAVTLVPNHSNSFSIEADDDAEFTDHSETIVYMSAEQAREVGKLLLSTADRVEEKNK